MFSFFFRSRYPSRKTVTFIEQLVKFLARQERYLIQSRLRLSLLPLQYLAQDTESNGHFLFPSYDSEDMRVIYFSHASASFTISVLEIGALLEKTILFADTPIRCINLSVSILILNRMSDDIGLRCFLHWYY